MKRQSLIYEILIFLLIFVFLIIPPFFNKPVGQLKELFSWTFPWKQAGLCIFALVLYFLSKNLNDKKGIFYPSLIALSLLFFTAIIIKLICHSATGENRLIMPQGGLEVLFCLITFALSAIYEEIIYRFYFTDALRRLIPIERKYIWIVYELAGLVVFAFAHFYLGWASVINATFAHVILRFLYKKTNLIWNCVIVHFIYNVISLILL
ncbi:MAG: CPBP family intramembrane metalloprotease [Treponema sp.]|nr:CPBP family intramembrane metalloprotease [Treponema sp.]